MEVSNSKMLVKNIITNVSKHKCHFEWRINGISAYLDTFDNEIGDDGERTLYSPTFTSGSAVGDKWCLEMTVNDERFIDKTVIIELDSVGSFNLGVRIQFTSFILDNEYQEKERIDCDQILNQSDYLDFAIVIPTNELMQNKNKFMFNDTLTIGAELTLVDITSSCLDNALSFGPKRQRITDEYIDLLKKEQDTDVVIKVDDKIFKAHRAILMARCPDLFKLFPTRKDGTEIEGEITIPDMDPGTFDTILQFIYTDEVNDLDGNAENLFTAANKLKLKKLRQMCLQSLLKSLTCQSAPRLFKFAYDYNLSEILDFIANYIVSNADKVNDTPENQTFIKLNPSMVNILLQKCVNLKVDGTWIFSG
ncbi:Similar to spop-b: Speckle-type POZ protein B (Xenopus laevis) [Cotesia congregata]|uniref:Similar to spop-b: Speckle-type POZ protein B (Xenopus laevis) n=1 Tax=Cotesia congregata TaxID=51543 RepID=A0A8J2MJ48_COTCN|nr:Similar to spop-b: Speckle-type POZ protein B (Xenopus laevis) [Cotesia congregata]